MRGLDFVFRRQKASSLAVVLLGVLVNSGMSLLTPLFLQALFDRCIAAKDLRLFATLLGGFVVVATAWRLLGLALSLRVQRMKEAVFSGLAAELMLKHFRLPYGRTSRLDPGYHASRIFDEPLEASKASVELAQVLAGCAASLASSTALLWALSTQATLLLALCVPPLVCLAGRFGAAVKRHAVDEKEEEGRLRGFTARAVRAVRATVLFGLEGRVAALLSERLRAYNGAAYGRLRSSSLHNTASGVLMSHAEVLVIVVCGYEMMRGRMSFGGFMAFMSAFWTAVSSLRQLTQRVPDLAKNEALVMRIKDTLEAAEAVPVPEGPAAVLRAAEFSYGGAPVLTGVDLTVRPGEAVLLEGANGTGKSTVTALLTGFLSPDRGSVRSFPRGRVSAAFSPEEFIPGTVADNLCRTEDGPYRRRLLRDLGLEDLLDRRPEALSSGQRKKAALAMALLKEADLYVFDEPLANLDTSSKEAVMGHIFERSAGKALLVVMHGDEEHRVRFDRVVGLGPAALSRTA